MGGGGVDERHTLKEKRFVVAFALYIITGLLQKRKNKKLSGQTEKSAPRTTGLVLRRLKKYQIYIIKRIPRGKADHPELKKKNSVSTRRRNQTKKQKCRMKRKYGSGEEDQKTQTADNERKKRKEKRNQKAEKKRDRKKKEKKRNK